MNKKVNCLFGTLFYVFIIVLQYQYVDWFREYADKITERAIDIWGITISFLLLLLGGVEILYIEFRKLYTIEYYCFFNDYMGIAYALKKKHITFLLLQTVVFLFLLVFYDSFLTSCLLSFLIVATISVVTYIIARKSIKSDWLAVQKNRIYFYDIKNNVLRKNVICQEVIRKIKTFDAMCVRIIVCIFYFLSTGAVEEERGLRCLLWVCLLLVSVCGERYIKNHAQTIIYLLLTTNQGKIILRRLIGTDCLLNNILLALIAFFSPLGIKGAMFAIIFGCAMTVYWDIFFMRIYSYNASAGAVAIGEFLALVIMLIPVANLFFCYNSYRKFSRRKDILA